MTAHPIQVGRSEMRLYDRRNRRLYINASERTRFVVAAKRFPMQQRTFCLTLLYTGCRISEALALTPASIQSGSGLITFRTLKRRGKHAMREVPIPRTLLRHLEHCHDFRTAPQSRRVLWQRNEKPVGRIAAYRWIKEVMAAAEIEGAQACPKGLRHGYGIHATLCGVQLHMLSKWMGHASIETTQIYADACGPEEQEIAERMWQASGEKGRSPTNCGGLSDADSRMLARAYDQSVGNPETLVEPLEDLKKRLGISDRMRVCFDNNRYFAVELSSGGFSVLLTIDRVAECVVGSVDVSLDS